MHSRRTLRVCAGGGGAQSVHSRAKCETECVRVSRGEIGSAGAAGHSAAPHTMCVWGGGSQCTDVRNVTQNASGFQGAQNPFWGCWTLRHGTTSCPHTQFEAQPLGGKEWVRQQLSGQGSSDYQTCCLVLLVGRLQGAWQLPFACLVCVSRTGRQCGNRKRPLTSVSIRAAAPRP